MDPNQPNYQWSNSPNFGSYYHPHNISDSENLQNSDDFHCSQYYQNPPFAPNLNETPISQQAISRSLFQETQNPQKIQKGQKNVWCVKEDIALMSSWIYVSEDGIKGRNQKGTTMWARIHKQYHEAQADNPDELNPRNVESLRGRFKRLNENANKWIEAYKETAKRRKSGMNQKDVETKAQAIYEAGGSKFQDLVVFNEVMCKHPKWDLNCVDIQRRDEASTLCYDIWE